MHDENDLRSEMSTWFSVDQDILVEYVYMKLKKPVQVGGFVKDFCPVAVVGQKYFSRTNKPRLFIFRLYLFAMSAAAAGSG